MSELDKTTERQHYVSHLDGRRVAFAIAGAPERAQVLFYSHGFPASRLEAMVGHRVAAQHGITIVALDRPGFGCSDWYPNRTLDDWGRDVELVADHLGIERFGILGVSGGAPTAIAAAGTLGHRVTSLTLVSGLAPIHDRGSLVGMNWANGLLLRVARLWPALGKTLVGAIAAAWRAIPRMVMVWFGILLPPQDRAIVSRRDVALLLTRNIQEALRQGIKGVISEFMLFTSDWRPSLNRVKVPTTIWHGDADSYVPVSMAIILQKGIPKSTLHQVKGGGHFMIVDTLPEILTEFAKR